MRLTYRIDSELVIFFVIFMNTKEIFTNFFNMHKIFKLVVLIGLLSDILVNGEAALQFSLVTSLLDGVNP